jgi:hypothetical protein
MSMTLPPKATPLPTLHLLGQFNAAFTGAETELLEIQRLLSGRRAVKVWSDAAPHPCYAGKGIATIQAFTQQFPKDGVLLIAGVHVRPAIWFKYTRFERVVLFYNLSSHLPLFALIANIREATGLEPELVFVSRMLQQSVGLPGRIARSLIDLQPFLDVGDVRLGAAREQLENDAQAPSRPFTVGRLSRDALDKHNPEDAMLYRMLASRGIRVRIMGGTCLAPALDGVEGIELLPAGAEPASDFYRSLDLFFYRTGVSTEAYGRVILEAMATGLPVVALRRGGYVEVVDDGVNGLLFRSQEESYDTIIALQLSLSRRCEIGAAAMQTAIEIHGPQAMEQELGFYLR